MCRFSLLAFLLLAFSDGSSLPATLAASLARCSAWPLPGSDFDRRFGSSAFLKSSTDIAFPGVSLPVASEDEELVMLDSSHSRSLR